MPKKFLIIRFSSIGDIIQCMGVINGINNACPDAEIHWIARKDMSSFLAMDTRIHKIWGFDRSDGLMGLLKIARKLKKEKFDFIYDAHSNIRSNILRSILTPRWKRLFNLAPDFALRSKNRFKRILLFKLRINRFPKPFKGIESYRKPLSKWGITDFSDDYENWYFPSETKENIEKKVFARISFNNSRTITIVPSATWKMKRWPVNHWKKLIKILPEFKFIIIAGPDDKFCEEIEAVAPERIFNFAGKTSLLESCYLIFKSKLIISADTGFLHAADIFKTKGISLMGPTAFGFTTGKHIKTLETPLTCRPCSKDGHGKCSQKVYQKCMVDIDPEQVAQEVQLSLK